METNPIAVDLTGKVAVITGGGGIICSGFSEVVARAGASVAILDRDLSAAKAVEERICAQGFRAKAYRADVLNRADLDQVHAQVLQDFGPCDILINGAGGNHPLGNTEDAFYNKEEAEGVKTFFQLDAEGFRYVSDLNFLGTLLPTQVFAADMLDRPDGTIINISSMNAIKPLTKLPAYSAAKAAVTNFTQWLAIYFSRAGIRVNAIAPGFFITNQNRANLLNADGSYTDRARQILAGTPMGRFGRVEELCGLLLFLLDSHAASFITGAVIPVDGGFQAYCGV